MSETLHDGGYGGDGIAQSFGHDHDHGSHGVHHHHHVGEFSSTPQGSVSWTSALRDVKLSDALQSIRFTTNQLFLLLFIALGSWLFVVYWVRHHEPLATQVLGSQTAKAPTAHIDRRLVAEMRRAVPVRTGPSTGMVFVPSGTVEAKQLPDFAAGQPVNSGYPSPYVLPSPQSVSSLAAFGHQSNNSGIDSPMPMPGSVGAYHVGVHTPDGLRLKTVVNR